MGFIHPLECDAIRTTQDFACPVEREIKTRPEFHCCVEGTLNEGTRYARKTLPKKKSQLRAQSPTDALATCKQMPKYQCVLPPR